MNGLSIRPADPFEDGAARLLRASHALMQSLFSPEENHFLSLDALRGTDIRFFVAEAAGKTVGTGAIALRDGYSEVKSMFTDPAARGLGAGAAMLARLEAETRAHGLALMRLETGTGLDAAHRLYARLGFVPRGPFGDYAANTTSVFMEKVL